MKKPFFQSICLRILYKGGVQWFLKIIGGVNLGDNKSIKEEEQFIILANHNSHFDTICLLAAMPGKLLWKVKPVAAEDYFGNTRLKARLSNFFINTLLIQRKLVRGELHNPIDKMLEALDQGYSLILFPEGTRSMSGEMNRLKSGIGRILSARPHIKYIPTYLSGMHEILPKGEFIWLPYKSSINFGKPTLVMTTEVDRIMEQIEEDFRILEKGIKG